jgi:hypothetical protein
MNLFAKPHLTKRVVSCLVHEPNLVLICFQLAIQIPVAKIW